MLISLDYYRILTVPIKANQEQINLAYQDRIQQKPRREYSKMAIEARQDLLQQAYDVLSDEVSRAEYDGKFLAKLQQEPPSIVETAISDAASNHNSLETPQLSLDQAVSLESQRLQDQIAATPTSKNREYAGTQNSPVLATGSSSISPTIDISPKLLVGALIILHELAEYEQVIRLGNCHLNNPAYLDQLEIESAIARHSNVNSASEKNCLIADDTDPRKDIVLAMTLSYLELGREKWRIQDYETAACSAQMGLILLQQEQIFYMLQEELTTDLHKLRPYRILDLLANSPTDSPQRATGLKLLQEMLEQRQGIEGKGEDYSGLKFDQFLGFIQQVRQYLTTTEQIELFEAEAKNRSFVGTYLAMYALLAQGYATKQPHLIVKAQEMLKFLSEGREEVHWEQAVCSLLLGQAKQAQNAIEQSQEKATVELIKQYSQDAPDLLPGLCFYGEKWLLREVLSQFQDLENCQVTLDDYFADKKVQSYLETISPVPTKLPNTPQVPTSTNVSDSKKLTFANWVSWRKPAKKSQSVQIPTHTNNIKSQPQNPSRGATATLEKKPNTLPKNPIKQPLTSQSYPGNNQQPKIKKRILNRRHSYSATLIKGSLLSLGLILGLGTLGFVFTRSLLQLASKSASNAKLPEIEATVSTEAAPANLAPEVVVEPPVVAKPKTLDKAIAQNVVETWLKVKSAALGNQHNIEQLSKILAPSQIPKWRGIALQDKNNNVYRQYQHTVTIRNVNFSENQPNQATIEAQVKETTQYYQKGKSTSFKSNNDNLVVRYQLIRQGESWLINKSEVVR